MKNKTVNNTGHRLFLVSILFVFILFAAQNKAIASENNSNKDTAINMNNSENLLVKYISSSENGLYFNVKYNNEEGQDFAIIIKNEIGETLYDGSFSDKTFDKKFLLPQDENVSFISISLKSNKDDFVQSYNVTISPNTNEEVVVAKNYIPSGISAFLN